MMKAYPDLELNSTDLALSNTQNLILMYLETQWLEYLLHLYVQKDFEFEQPSKFGIRHLQKP